MLSNLKKLISGKANIEPVLSVDIGSHSIKVMEFDPRKEEPTLLSAGIGYTPDDCFHNNVISNPELVGKAIRNIVDANGISAKKVVTSVAGVCCFSKSIKTGVQTLKELRNTIPFEVNNYIPHDVSDVSLDFQVLGKKSNTALDVLIVAVTNEVVNGYVESIKAADLEVVVLDVDSYALNNMFEVNYPEEGDRTVAILNIGAKFTSVNIEEKGNVLYRGEVSVGGNLYTKALSEALGINEAEAEDLKKGKLPDGVDPELVRETIERTSEKVAIELERQVGFFWDAIESKKTIDVIYITGGCSLIPGLSEELSIKTGVETKNLDNFRKIGGLDSFEDSYLKQIGPLLGVSVGLAGRQIADKVNKF